MTQVKSKAMAPHSSTLAWKIPWMEEPGGLQSMGLLRVGHDWATSLSFFTFMHWKGNGNPLQCSCLENPRDGGAWWAAVYGVTQSRTRLRRLSSSNSRQWPIGIHPWCRDSAVHTSKLDWVCNRENLLSLCWRPNGLLGITNWFTPDSYFFFNFLDLISILLEFISNF